MSDEIFRKYEQPEQAVDALQKRFEVSMDALRTALEAYFESRTEPSARQRRQFCYPMLRVTYQPDGRVPANRRAFAKFPGPGVYASTITHPKDFKPYLLEQLTPLVDEYGATVEVGLSEVEIPYAYVFEKGDELGRDGVLAADLARIFPVPSLNNLSDDIADCAIEHRPNSQSPLCLFDAPRVDFSLKRLVHYTGSDWRHIQPWLLLTNYQRYVDQFLEWGLDQLYDANSSYTKLVLPGNLVLTAAIDRQEAEKQISTLLWHRYQMPAYHLYSKSGAGFGLINIGVGPSNAKNITDHLAVLRPHCWLMVGHCGGLRQSQEIGDYVLAHGYLREDHILDSIVPIGVPIPALAEVQVALQEAAAKITGDHGESLKKRLRTGTVVTYDDRNWELRIAQERQRINMSRAIAVDMESATVATQGFRMRVPYGTLLCVSDKPMHGEIKLPGAANAFYERSITEHLHIGLLTLQLLQRDTDSLHSRKLRSFDEPPFR